MAVKPSITNEKVYDLVNSLRLEIKQDILNMGVALTESHGRLEKKFDELEAGRLTRAEGNINRLQVQNATQTTKLAILGFIASCIIGSVISVFITQVIAK